LVFLAIRSNSRTLTKCAIFFRKEPHPFFDLHSKNSHFPPGLDMRIWYCWKAYWIKIPMVQTVSKYIQ